MASEVVELIPVVRMLQLVCVRIAVVFSEIPDKPGPKGCLPNLPTFQAGANNGGSDSRQRRNRCRYEDLR
jgi:hypothetical protein